MNLTFAGSGTAPGFDLSAPDIEIWRDIQGRATAFGQTVGGENWMHVPGIGSFRLGNRERPSSVLPEPGVQEWQVTDTYYRNVLPMVLHLSGLEVLHASAVVNARGVIALCAQSETGKSTLAYAMRQRGYSLFADDALAFRVEDGRPILGQVPFAIRLRRSSAEHFRAKPREEVRVGGEPSPLTETDTRMAAVCVLARSTDDRQSVLEEADRASVVEVERLLTTDALSAVIANAYRFSLRDHARLALMIAQYMALVASVPVLKVRFRSGLEHLPTILDEVERAIGRVHVEGAV